MINFDFQESLWLILSLDSTIIPISFWFMRIIDKSDDIFPHVTEVNWRHCWLRPTPIAQESSCRTRKSGSDGVPDQTIAKLTSLCHSKANRLRLTEPVFPFSASFPIFPSRSLYKSVTTRHLSVTYRCYIVTRSFFYCKR